MEKILDCYGKELKPGDTVITHVQWGSDVKKYYSGIIKLTFSHLSTTGSGRVILTKDGLKWAQRWPDQVAKYEEINTSN